ncbi:hypothetical protein CEXT_791221 [Caerostris extrusa]|uniref:Large ribosomal subunit protein P1 n=1 Tax=Caerostris extrusa TaxID=172846 RepID=A0AAV4VMN7_CAEEX|nr:hypothetical protein CEXT_791221 [Caerostris extrusa]
MISTDETACIYAALILQDDDIAITAEKISTILKAAGVNVEPYWPTLFTKALVDVNMKQMITNVGTGAGGAASASAGVTTAGGEASATAEESNEEKEESDAESDDDMGFGLFD